MPVQSCGEHWLAAALVGLLMGYACSTCGAEVSRGVFVAVAARVVAVVALVYSGCRNYFDVFGFFSVDSTSKNDITTT